tara:strand:- start:1462 stop:1752 length:291 start_codon:yes stop_codon:yes gene_type:complete
MKISLSQRHLFNESKPMIQLWGPDAEKEHHMHQSVDRWVQWDECDLSDSPPYRLPGSMTAHGKFPTYNYEELPTVFKDMDGNVHDIEDIIAYKSSK